MFKTKASSGCLRNQRHRHTSQYHRNRIVADRFAELREFLSAYIPTFHAQQSVDFDCYAKGKHSMVVCEGSWADRSEGKVEQTNFLRFRQSFNDDYRGNIV